MLRGQNSLRSSQQAYVSQIIYPVSKLLPVKSHAYLVGWNLENFRCCIACVVEVPRSKYRELSETLLKCSEDFSGIFASCSKDGSAVPLVLGEWIPTIGSDFTPDEKRLQDGIWVTLTTNPSSPGTVKLHSLHSLGQAYSTSCYLFQYEGVNTDRLSCLHIEEQASSKTDSSPQRLATLPTKSELDLIVAQINASHELSSAIAHYLSAPSSDNGGGGGGESKFLSKYTTLSAALALLSMVGTTILTGPTWLWHALLYKFNKFLRRKFVMFSMGNFFATWLGLRGNGSIAEGSGSSSNVATSSSAAGGEGSQSKPGGESGAASSSVEGISFCDFSLTAVYFSERITVFEACLRKCALFPSAWGLPARLKQSLWMSIMSFICLTLVDTLLGCVVGYYIFMNADQLVALTEQTCYRAQTSLIIDTLEWFNHSPGGVKLNVVITTQIGTALRKLVNTYHTLLLDTQVFHLPVCKLVACVGCLGFTAQLVVLVDIFRVITLHIAFIHRTLSFLHQLQLQLLYSLYLLFWGQKKNVLRQRVDTCEYDQHQQLFGIVFFVIAVFCFPTFAAYYYLFAFAQLGVVLAQYLLWSTTIAIKEFPFYALFVFLCLPKMLSSDVQFSLVPTGATATVVETTRRSPKEQSASPTPTSIKAADRPTSEAAAPVSPKKANRASVKGILKTGGGEANGSSAKGNKMSRFTHEILSDGSKTSLVHFEEARADGALLPAKSADEPPQSSLSIVAPLLIEDPTDEALSFQRGGGSEVSLPFRLEPDSPLSMGGNRANIGGFSRGEGQSRIRNYTLSSVGNSSNTVYLALVPRRPSLTEVFAGYALYLRYIVAERGFAMRVLRGIFLGRPALDIQLIHATASLAHMKALRQQTVISAAFSRGGGGRRGSRRAVTSRRTAVEAKNGPEAVSSAYNCFNQNGFSRSTMKNRKAASAGSGRASPSAQLPVDEDLAGGGGALDHVNVFDLPEDGFPMRISFWDSIRLAQSNIDEMDANEEESGGDSGRTDRPSSSTGGPSRRVSGRQLGLSKLLLYLVLVAATLNLALTLFGGCVLLGSLLPLAWRLKAVSLYDHSGTLGTALSSESGTASLLSSNITAALGLGAGVAAAAAASPRVLFPVP